MTVPTTTTRTDLPAVKSAHDVAAVRAYRPPPHGLEVALRLDSNEGTPPPAELLEKLTQLKPSIIRDYPSTWELQDLLAARFHVEPEQVVVTAGADDALDRACRAVLEPGTELILPTPTFEMLERYPRFLGATCKPIPWPGGPYPRNAVIKAVSSRTRAIAVVSPNNPTGAVATVTDLKALSAAAPGALLIVDLAYVEFAAEDPTQAVLALPNAVAVRTFSKAWGLAGLRVGYALGPSMIMEWLRTVGSPYPTSGVALWLAAERLKTGADDVRQFAQCVRAQRDQLRNLLLSFGASVLPSQANFLLVRLGDAARVRADLAERGIAVRSFSSRPQLADCVRVTLPGEESAFSLLTTAFNDLFIATPETFRVTCAADKGQ